MTPCETCCEQAAISDAARVTVMLDPTPPMMVDPWMLEYDGDGGEEWGTEFRPQVAQTGYGWIARTIARQGPDEPVTSVPGCGTLFNGVPHELYRSRNDALRAAKAKCRGRWDELRRTREPQWEMG